MTLCPDFGADAYSFPGASVATLIPSLGYSRMKPTTLMNAIATLSLFMCSTGAMGHPGHHPPDAQQTQSLTGDTTLLDTRSYLQAQLKEQPDNTLLLSKLGGVQLDVARVTGHHADYIAAERTFDDLLRVNRDSMSGRIGKAYALLGLHRFREALAQARLAALLEESDVVLALLADAHLALGHIVEAEAIADLLVERSLTLETLGRCAVIAFERSRYDEARDLMLEAREAGSLLEAGPGAIAWCETMLGDIEANAGRIDQALDWYSRAEKTSAQAHAAAFGRARILVLRGDLQGAEAVLDRLVERFPRVPYRIALAEVLLESESDASRRRGARLIGDAEAELEAEVAADDMGHVRELIELMLRHGPDASRASELAVRELWTVREDHGAHEVAGWALFHAGRLQDAVPLMRAALRLSPAHPRTLLRGGLVLEAAGEREGRVFLQRAIDSGAPLPVEEVRQARQVLSSPKDKES